MYRSHSLPVIAVLPRAPKNGSPVPGLTSLYHKANAGPYGNWDHENLAQYPEGMPSFDEFLTEIGSKLYDIRWDYGNAT